MDRESNLNHWESLGKAFGKNLQATTKCTTIKLLEIDAFADKITRYVSAPNPVVLEIGCGNGFNGFALLERFLNLRYIGVDFSANMIEAACAIAQQDYSPEIAARAAFGVQDAREIASPFFNTNAGPFHIGEALKEVLRTQSVDVVMTDRMLINLSSAQEQLQVMSNMIKCLNSDGIFLMLENDAHSHQTLNQTRKVLGMEPRPVASYNIFIDHDQVIAPFMDKMSLIESQDVSAIHDLILYAVAPSVQGGQINYDSELMKNLTRAIIELNATPTVKIDGFGQNRLWVWKKHPKN
jgi:SAM-dependent methyltransferase